MGGARITPDRYKLSENNSIKYKLYKVIEGQRRRVKGEEKREEEEFSLALWFDWTRIK